MKYDPNDLGFISGNWKEVFADWANLEPGMWSMYGMRVALNDGDRFEVGLYREENKGEYASEYTVQAFFNNKVILCYGVGNGKKEV